MTKLRTFNSRYFLGKRDFEDGGAQNYLVIYSQWKDYLNRLVILNIFQRGNLKDCLIKTLILVLHLIMVLLQG